MDTKLFRMMFCLVPTCFSAAVLSAQPADHPDSDPRQLAMARELRAEMREATKAELDASIPAPRPIQALADTGKETGERDGTNPIGGH